MIAFDDVYKIGTIAKAHGLRGEVVFLFTDDTFDRTDADYLIIDIEGILVPFFIEEYRFRSENSALMKFDGIDSAEQSQQVLGRDVYLEKSKAADGGEEEMSLSYFVGFGIRTTGGQGIGTVAAVDDNTDNWLFVVERPGSGEMLVPAHEAFIASIDHEARLLTMDLPEGLLDL